VAKNKRPRQWRCDHCGKFINERHAPCHLGETVSPGVEFNFSICQKCLEKHGDSRDYWDKWVAKTLESIDEIWHLQIWHLFTYHREPYELAECYVGLQNKSSEPFFEFAIWESGKFLDGTYTGNNRLFGELDPALLLPGVYWCFASNFSSKDAAKKSFQDFLSQPFDQSSRSK